MHNKVIIYGELKKYDDLDIAFEVEDCSSGRFTKVLEELVEYVIVDSDHGERIKNSCVHENTTICYNKRLEEDKSICNLNRNEYQALLAIPDMETKTVEEVLHIAMMSRVENPRHYAATIIGGHANTYGEMILTILRQFRVIENKVELELILYVPKELTIEELSQIEDAINEYRFYENSLYIKQKVIDHLDRFYYMINV